MKRKNKDADELAIQLRGAISLLKIVDFGRSTDASFKRGWKLSIKGMEAALRAQNRLKPLTTPTPEPNRQKGRGSDGDIHGRF